MDQSKIKTPFVHAVVPGEKFVPDWHGVHLVGSIIDGNTYGQPGKSADLLTVRRCIRAALDGCMACRDYYLNAIAVDVLTLTYLIDYTCSEMHLHLAGATSWNEAGLPPALTEPGAESFTSLDFRLVARHWRRQDPATGPALFDTVRTRPAEVRRGIARDALDLLLDLLSQAQVNGPDTTPDLTGPVEMVNPYGLPLGVLPSDLQRTDTVMDVSDEPDITAAVARIRTAVGQEFRNHGDADLHPTETSTGERLSVELTANRPDSDARVLRVLAARIARAGTANEDPLLTLTDVAAALKSLAVAVAALAGRELHDTSGPEALVTYAATVGQLRDAADNVAELAGWF